MLLQYLLKAWASIHLPRPDIKTRPAFIQSLFLFKQIRIESYYSNHYILLVLYRRNEELDDKVVIRKLKKRVAELEAEIASLKDSNQYPAAPLPLSNQEERNQSSFSRSLSESDRQRCHQILNDFFHGKVDNPVAAGEQHKKVYKFGDLLIRESPG